MKTFWHDGKICPIEVIYKIIYNQNRKSSSEHSILKAIDSVSIGHMVKDMIADRVYLRLT